MMLLPRRMCGPSCVAHTGARLDERHFFRGRNLASSRCCYCDGIHPENDPDDYTIPLVMLNAEISPFSHRRHVVDPDGNCLFSSISMCIYGVPDHHLDVRQRIYHFHVEYAEWLKGQYVWQEAKDLPGNPFLPDWSAYCEYIRVPGTWGGQHEITAAAHIYQRSILTITPTSTTIVSPPTSNHHVTIRPSILPPGVQPATSGETHIWVSLISNHYNAITSYTNGSIPDSQILVHHRNKALDNLLPIASAPKTCSDAASGACKAPRGITLTVDNFQMNVDDFHARSNTLCNYCSGAPIMQRTTKPRKPRTPAGNLSKTKGLGITSHPGGPRVHPRLGALEWFCTCSKHCNYAKIVSHSAWKRHQPDRDDDIADGHHQYSLSAAQISDATKRSTLRRASESAAQKASESHTPPPRNRPKSAEMDSNDNSARAARVAETGLRIKRELLERATRLGSSESMLGIESADQPESIYNAAAEGGDDLGGQDIDMSEPDGGDGNGIGGGAGNGFDGGAEDGEDADDAAERQRTKALADLLLVQSEIELEIFQPEASDAIHPSDNLYQEDWDGENPGNGADDQPVGTAGLRSKAATVEDEEEEPPAVEEDLPDFRGAEARTLGHAWYEVPAGEYLQPSVVINPTAPPTFDDLPKTSPLPIINEQLLFINLLRNANYANAPMSPADIRVVTQRLTSRVLPKALTDRAKPIIVRSLRAWFEFHHDPERVYKSHCRLMGALTPPVYMLSLFQVKSLAESMSGVKAMEDAMCVNGCMSFSGPNSALDHCTYPSEDGLLPGICGEDRWKRNKRGAIIVDKQRVKQPRKRGFSYLLGPQVQAQWGSEESAKSMRYAYRSLQEKSAERKRYWEEADEREARGLLPLPETRVFDDWTSGDAVLDKFDRGDFDPDDFFFLYTCDAAKLYTKRDSSTFFGAMENLNLPPGERTQMSKIMPSILIPGPKKPKNLTSFLYPTFHHISAMMNESFEVYDAAEHRWMTSHIHLIYLCADGPGLAEVNGHVGHGGAKGCRFMCDVVGVLKGTLYYPALQLPVGHRARYGRRNDADPGAIAAWVADQGDMMRRVHDLLGAETEGDLEKRKTRIGLSFPTILFGLPESHTLGFPDVNTFDIMHVVALNMPDHLLGIWRGLHAKEAKETGSFAWEFLKDDEVWKRHGALVAACLIYIPDLFGRPPRDPALFINSGYKASEFLLYIFMLGPGLFYGLMPTLYYLNFCRLVRAMNIFQQRSISSDDLQVALDLVLDFAEEFERIYVQRSQRRIHWVRPWLHTILHLAKQVTRNGPPAYYAQWTLERMIGFITKDLRNHTLDGSGVNVALILLHLAQLNAMTSINPDLPLPVEDSHLIINLGDGYHLLHKRDPTPTVATEIEAKAIASFLQDRRGAHASGLWMKKRERKRSARLRLPCGLLARSAFAEEERVGGRVTRMVQLVYRGRTRYAEVLHYCQLWRGASGDGAVAVVVLCSEPDEAILAASMGVTRFVKKGSQEEDLVVVDVKAISTVVGLFPNIREGYWYVGNKPGRAGAEADDPEAAVNPEDGAGGE